jgi:hypothetical protein
MKETKDLVCLDQVQLQIDRYLTVEFKPDEANSTIITMLFLTKQFDGNQAIKSVTQTSTPQKQGAHLTMTL